jgi:hypothetical protein
MAIGKQSRERGAERLGHGRGGRQEASLTERDAEVARDLDEERPDHRHRRHDGGDAGGDEGQRARTGSGPAIRRGHQADRVGLRACRRDRSNATSQCGEASIRA